MKRKNFIALFLIGSLIAPFAGTYVWLRVQRKNVRREVKWLLANNANKSELVLLKFAVADSSNIHWKHSKEFEHNGLMFDIVHRKTDKDSLVYWCWPDHQETKLNKQLDHVLADVLNQNPWRKQRKTELLGFLKKWQTSVLFSFRCIVFEADAIHQFFYHKKPAFLAKNPTTYPPKLLI